MNPVAGRLELWGWALALITLLGCFALRVHNIHSQPPFIDEGFHIERARIIWDWREHPARFSHGKLLLYFWLNPFVVAPIDLTQLASARWAVALTGMISGACLYRMARDWAGSSAALITLLMYACSPLALFFERMALADPLAAMMGVLVAWRSLIFVRRPTRWRGIALAALLVLATLAKLTIVLVGVLPVLAMCFFGQRRCWPSYVRMLAWTAGLAAVVWAFILIPAWLAYLAGDPFVLVPHNTMHSGRDWHGLLAHGQAIVLALADFMGAHWLAGLLIGLLMLCMDRRMRRPALWVVLWLLVLALPAVLAGRLITARYYAPLAAPLALLFGLWWAWLAETGRPGRWLATMIVGGWLVGFAIPFGLQAATSSRDLPLTTSNQHEYQSGRLIVDETTLAAIKTFNAMPAHSAYASWYTCHIIQYYVARPVRCLRYERPFVELASALESSAPGEPILFITSDMQPGFDEAWGAILLMRHERGPGLHPVQIWQLLKAR